MEWVDIHVEANEKNIAKLYNLLTKYGYAFNVPMIADNDLHFEKIVGNMIKNDTIEKIMNSETYTFVNELYESAIDNDEDDEYILKIKNILEQYKEYKQNKQHDD